MVGLGEHGPWRPKAAVRTRDHDRETPQARGLVDLFDKKVQPSVVDKGERIGPTLCFRRVERGEAREPERTGLAPATQGQKPLGFEKNIPIGGQQVTAEQPGQKTGHGRVVQGGHRVGPGEGRGLGLPGLLALIAQEAKRPGHEMTGLDTGRGTGTRE